MNDKIDKNNKTDFVNHKNVICVLFSRASGITSSYHFSIYKVYKQDVKSFRILKTTYRTYVSMSLLYVDMTVGRLC